MKKLGSKDTTPTFLVLANILTRLPTWLWVIRLHLVGLYIRVYIFIWNVASWISTIMRLNDMIYINMHREDESRLSPRSCAGLGWPAVRQRLDNYHCSLIVSTMVWCTRADRLDCSDPRPARQSSWNRSRMCLLATQWLLQRVHYTHWPIAYQWPISSRWWSPRWWWFPWLEPLFRHYCWYWLWPLHH